MKRDLVVGIILLPGSILVLVPGLVLWLTGDWLNVPSPGLTLPIACTAAIIGSIGLGLSIWSARLFGTVGEGTPAPWAPPRKFVLRGPYRHVRNPMLAGVMFMLAAECLAFQSWYLFAWLIVFFLVATIYIAKVEEPELEQRFGEDFHTYRKNVRRWIPRWQPWHPS